MNDENELNKVKVDNKEETTNTNKEEIDEITMQPKKHREFDENMKMPEIDKTQKEIETVKKKPKSPIPYIIILLAVSFLSIYYIDDIMNFIDTLTKPKTLPIVTNNNDNNKEKQNNYIKLNDNTSNTTIEKIKFYNFQKNIDNQVISFNYILNEKIDKLNDKNIYIELYNSKEELIYKTQFTSEEVLLSNQIKSYSLKLNNEIYNDSYYINILTYTETDINKESKLTCTYTETNNYSLTYKNEYIFKNDLLVSYNISKQISYITENEMTKKYKKEIDTEFNKLKEHNIDSIYANNTLTYTIDLSKELNGFIPLYEKDTTIYVVKNKDTNKKWKCE